eukprot:14945889-Ditylum_brightwellii.AAC.1
MNMILQEYHYIVSFPDNNIMATNQDGGTVSILTHGPTNKSSPVIASFNIICHSGMPYYEAMLSAADSNNVSNNATTSAIGIAERKPMKLLKK